MTGLLGARLLFPSEAAATEGDDLPLVMLWLALGVVWLLGGIGRKRMAFQFGAIDATVLVLVAWECFASAYAVLYGSPRPALNMLWEWVGLGMMFFLARQLLHKAATARAIVAAMVAVMAAVSVYGFYQRAIELPHQQKQYAADPEGTMRAAEVDFPPGTPMREVLENRLKNLEPMGTFALTNSLAAALAPWLVASLWIATAAWPRRQQWFAWLVCIILIAACLLLTKSRSGYIAAGLGIAWLAFRRLPAVWFRAMVLAGLLAAAAMFAFTNAATSFSYRMQYWQATLRMITDHPLMGCGPGNYQDVYTQYKLPQASEEVSDPHNFLLEVWATAGTPALLAFLAVLSLWSARIYHRVAPAAERLSAGRNDWKFVLGGLIGGFLLSVPLGIISTAPPSLVAVVLGLPAAVTCFALLVPWVREGVLPQRVAGAAVAVLLVDLLTTGGIGFPAVAQSLWLFLALGLDAGPPRQMPRGVVVLLLVICLGLVFACHQTSFARVLECQGLQRSARREYGEGRGQSAEEQMQRAVAADPLSADARDFMAELYLQSWLAYQEPADYQAFEDQDTLARRLAPKSANFWRASAARWQRAYAKTDAQGRHVQPGAIEKAIAIARREVELYPSSAADRAELAAIYKISGDEASFRREAMAALELDNKMPHAEKKLPPAMRRRLEEAGE
jgi:hypothetical protein